MEGEGKGFELFKDRAGDGEIIATGEASKSKASAKRGIESISPTCPRRRSIGWPGVAPHGTCYGWPQIGPGSWGSL